MQHVGGGEENAEALVCGCGKLIKALKKSRTAAEEMTHKVVCKDPKKRHQNLINIPQTRTERYLLLGLGWLLRDLFILFYLSLHQRKFC